MNPHRLGELSLPYFNYIELLKFPVMWLAIHGHRPIAEINDFVDTRLKQQIETIPGVGGVMYGGLRPRTMRVWLNGKQLHAYNLDALDVMRGLRSEHMEKPAEN